MLNEEMVEKKQQHVLLLQVNRRRVTRIKTLS